MKNFINTNKGFTLAEVLITLAVIGVVASTTIPTMMNSTSDKELRSKWRKVYSSLANATKMIVTDNDGSLKGAYSSDQELIDMYSTALKVIKTCANDERGDVEGNCWFSNDGSEKRKYFNGDLHKFSWSFSGYGFTLADGTFIMITEHTSLTSACTASDAGSPSNEICEVMYIDVNGNTPPNQVGRDIYQIFLHENRIEPYKTPSSDPSERCNSTNGSGWGCASNWLYSTEEAAADYGGI